MNVDWNGTVHSVGGTLVPECEAAIPAASTTTTEPVTCPFCLNGLARG